MPKSVFSHLFPPRCLVCGAYSIDIRLGVCAQCVSRIRPIPGPVCTICGDPTGTEGVCLRCLTAPPPFDRMMSAFIFEGPIKDIIHSFKYADATYYKKYLAQVLFEMIKAQGQPCDVVTFVPLHWTRMISRGYNQAALIATELAGLLGLRVSYSALKKTRGTPPQVGLRRQERKMNIRGAFLASGVQDKAVLVVDDVVTTGQTAREVSKALKKTGASYVLFASVGRIVQ
jgi:ComF family protein